MLVQKGSSAFASVLHPVTPGIRVVVLGVRSAGSKVAVSPASASSRVVAKAPYTSDCQEVPFAPAVFATAGTTMCASVALSASSEYGTNVASPVLLSIIDNQMGAGWLAVIHSR